MGKKTPSLCMCGWRGPRNNNITVTTTIFIFGASFVRAVHAHHDTAMNGMLRKRKLAGVSVTGPDICHVLLAAPPFNLSQK